MVDFVVPVQSATIIFRTVDGMSFEGTLSLHLNAENHPGTETVLDRLNDPNLFLPLRVPGDLPVVFLNKIHIVRVDVSHEEGTTADPEDVVETNLQPDQGPSPQRRAAAGNRPDRWTERAPAPVRFPEHPACVPAPRRAGAAASAP